jgi:hypothetical protein
MLFDVLHPSAMPFYFLVFLALVTLVWPHSPTKEVSGASILHLDQRSLKYLTMPRNLQRSLTCFGGVIATIACVLLGGGFMLLGGGFMPVLVGYTLGPQFQQHRILTWGH